MVWSASHPAPASAFDAADGAVRPAGEATLPPPAPGECPPTSLEQLLRQRRVLMLQGPIGWFFARLAALLRAQQLTVPGWLSAQVPAATDSGSGAGSSSGSDSAG